MRHIIVISTGKYVAYYRVSTGKQGRSGLGVEAQQQAVKTYLDGADWEIVEEFTEVESANAPIGPLWTRRWPPRDFTVRRWLFRRSTA